MSLLPPMPEPAPKRRPRWPWFVLGAVAVLLIVSGATTIIVYAKGRALFHATTSTGPSGGGPSRGGPAGTPGSPGPNAAPRGVLCDFRPAGDPAPPQRLVPTPAPRATLTGLVHATVKTGLGDIAVQLDGGKAPCTVQSFVHLSTEDFYADTDCHRLTTSGIWVLQCGDPTGTGTGSPGYQFGEENLPTGAAPRYPRGTLAMANAGPGTSGSQFFIVYRDSDIPPDYTMFGTVTGGLDLLDRVAAAGTDAGTDGRPKLRVHIDEVTIGP